MPFTKKELLTAVTALLFLVSIQNLRSQTNSETSLYKWFDESVGKENSEINNGQLYLNYYKTINNTHSYLNNETFEKGNVVYENQSFNDVVLNYDIFKDNLLLKPNGINDRRLVILITRKIQSFTFAGKSFANLSSNPNAKADFIKGFYEENFIGENFTFYIKHFKEMREVTSEGKIYDDFKIKNSFVIAFKNKFYTIDSKRTLTDIFPELKSKIDDYYLSNSKIEELNKTLFMESLMRYINPILK